MKIIGIGRELPGQVYLMADSAIVKTGKPFFVPHFAHNFTGTPALVMHIDRLGKHIAPRFAHRYCLAVAPAIKVTARGIDAEQHHQATSALAHSFDGALLLGLSVYFTLKMGDMIAVELAAATLELTPGDTLHAAINGDLKLTTRVK